VTGALVEMIKIVNVGEVLARDTDALGGPAAAKSGRRLSIPERTAPPLAGLCIARARSAATGSRTSPARSGRSCAAMAVWCPRAPPTRTTPDREKAAPNHRN
jgi:hypothetical protein